LFQVISLDTTFFLLHVSVDNVAEHPPAKHQEHPSLVHRGNPPPEHQAADSVVHQDAD
jgi:hypothetical protein